MGIAYVFYLVALLQVSLCQVTENATTDITTEESLMTDSQTTLASQDLSTEVTESVVRDSTTTEQSNEVESMSYQPVDADNATTTSTVQPEPVPASTSPTGHASSVAAPTVALAAALALCVRLFSSKLYGLV